MKKLMNFGRFSAAVALALAATSACGRGRPSGSGAATRTAASASTAEPSDPLATAKRLCEALHAYPTRRKAECCGGRGGEPLVDECVRLVRTSLEHQAVRIDEQSTIECERETRQRLTGCDWVTPGRPLAPAACGKALEGRLDAGKACRSSLECRGNLHCAGVTPTTPGVCTAPAAIGAACGVHVDALASYVLARGLEVEHPFCADFCSLVTHKCEAVPAAGSACFASVNCAPSQSCRSGRCSDSAPARDGESCETTACAAGLRCDHGVCHELARPGEACTNDFECELGGCVAAASGEQRCGMKCIPSLSGLASSRSPALRLPLRPRGTH